MANYSSAEVLVQGDHWEEVQQTLEEGSDDWSIHNGSSEEEEESYDAVVYDQERVEAEEIEQFGNGDASKVLFAENIPETVSENMLSSENTNIVLKDEKNKELSLLNLLDTLDTLVEKKKLEKENRDMADKIGIIGRSADIFTKSRPDGVLTKEEGAVERIVGYTPEELEGEDAFDYIHEQDQKKVSEAFKNAEIGENMEFTYRFQHKEGGYVWLEATAVRSPEGEHVINNRDVTEREVMDRVLTHDVKNELNKVGAIKSWDIEELPEQYQRMYEIATCGLKETEITIDTLGDLRSARQSNHSPVRVNNLLEDIKSNYSAELEDEGIELYIENSSDFEVGKEIRSVFRNLINNSREHADCDRIDITAEDHEGELYIDYRDNGVGLDPEEDIFELREKGDDSNGTGIGAYVSRKIVENYGGEMNAENWDDGARFEMKIPRNQD